METPTLTLCVERDEDALNLCPECFGNRMVWRVFLKGIARGIDGQVIVCPHCESVGRTWKGEA